MEKDNNKSDIEKKKEKQRLYHKMYYHQVRKNKKKLHFTPIVVENKKNGRIIVEF
jgi:hypothetical protein